jgi:PTH1 family peptidyl-tRNA hydrolase
MKLVVGLGNPGKEYAGTRHNAGFMALDHLAEGCGQGSWQSAHHGLVLATAIGAERVLLLKPMTYMNLSGKAVAEALRYYRLSLVDLLVVVDDVALPCGTLRIRGSGSSGGHNGLASIEALLAAEAVKEGKSGRDFARLRIGVDSPGRVPLESYVLQGFSPAQWKLLSAAFLRVRDAVKCWVLEGLTPAMNRYNADELR